VTSERFCLFQPEDIPVVRIIQRLLLILVNTGVSNAVSMYVDYAFNGQLGVLLDMKRSALRMREHRHHGGRQAGRQAWRRPAVRQHQIAAVVVTCPPTASYAFHSFLRLCMFILHSTLSHPLYYYCKQASYSLTLSLDNAEHFLPCLL